MRTNPSTAVAAAAVALATLAAGAGVVTASAAPTVAEPRTTTVTAWHGDEVTAVVRFANRSAKLRKKARRTLRATAAAVPDDARKVRSRVVGWVQQGGSHDLSVRRAKRVKRALVDRGVDGRWKVKGKGVDGPTRNSRKATVRIRFKAPVQATVSMPAAPAAQTVTATVTDTVSSTATVTATTTETATATVTATETTTVAVPTTVTATTTETVTAAPVLTPVNVSVPTVDYSFGEDVTLTADQGQWEGGARTPESYTVVWQGGTYVWDPNVESMTCTSYADLSSEAGWTGWSVTTTWDQIPSCFRVVVTATNQAGSTVAVGTDTTIPI